MQTSTLSSVVPFSVRRKLVSKIIESNSFEHCGRPSRFVPDFYLMRSGVRTLCRMQCLSCLPDQPRNSRRRSDTFMLCLAIRRLQRSASISICYKNHTKIVLCKQDFFSRASIILISNCFFGFALKRMDGSVDERGRKNGIGVVRIGGFG